MKKGLKYTFIVLLIINLLIVFSGNTYLYKTIFYNTADIDDYLIFNQRKISAQNGVEWPISSRYNQVKLPGYLSKELERLESVAFLIIQDDSVFYESYWDGYGKESISNSFSVAKSVVGILVGMAIDEKKIQSLDQAVGDFLPSFKEGKKSHIRIRDLLTMSSGLDWNEAYMNPFSSTSRAYYGTDLPDMVNDLGVAEEPGKVFRYQSINSEVLAMVIEKACGMSLSAYASEKLWKPLQSMRDASWSLDHPDGMEKAYCCIYSNAADFARLGSLYLHQGSWKGKQLVSANYVKESVHPAPLKMDDGTPNDCYGYAWWVLPNYKGHMVYYARGILGQYIAVIPDTKTIVVRLGKKRGNKIGNHCDDLFVYLDGALEMIK